MREQGPGSISLRVEYDPLLDELDVTVTDVISDPATAAEVQDGVVAVFDLDGSLARLHVSQASFGRSPEWRVGLANLIGPTAEHQLEAASRACLPLQSTWSVAGEEAVKARIRWAAAFKAVGDESEYLLELIAETSEQGSEPARTSSFREILTAKGAVTASWMRETRQRIADLWGTAAEAITDYRPVPALGPVRGAVGGAGAVRSEKFELDSDFARRAGVYPAGGITMVAEGIEIELTRIESHDVTLAVTWKGAQGNVALFAGHEYRAVAQLPAEARELAGTDLVLGLVFFTVG